MTTQLKRSIGGRRAAQLLAAVVALAVAGCAQVQQNANRLTAQARAATHSGLEATDEKVFSVLWWEKVEGTSQRPFKPVELAAPEVDPLGGRIFAATRDGFLSAFTARGKRLWERQVGGPFHAGPALADEVLYLGNARGEVAAFSAKDGGKLWSYAAGEALLTQPVVTESLVLVMTAADTLIALDRQTGTWRWQYRRELPGGLTLFGAARPAVEFDKVYAGFADGHAVALDLATGGVLWEKQLSRAAAFMDLDASPILDGWGRVYFASNSDGVFCLDALTGELRWSHLRAGITSLALNESGDKVYAGGQGFVGLFDAETGKPRWGRALEGETAVFALTETVGLLLVSQGGAPLLFLDAASGALRSVFEPGHGVTAAARANGLGEAAVLSNRGYLYSLALHP